MAFGAKGRLSPQTRVAQGFSMLEMLASVAIITLLMSAVFAFMYQAQRRFQGNVVITESNQSARAALELITQEIGQAGYNPQYYPHKTGTVAITANAAPQCLTLNDPSHVNVGDWLQVDTGTNNEIAQVLGVTGNPPPNPPYATVVCASAGANQIYAVFEMNHPTTPFPVISYKMPYPTGILQETGTSSDQTLEFFGDINNDGVIRYVVYSLTPTTSPASTVTIDGATYTLYTLRRSITPVTFMAGAVNNASSPLVQNVLYDATNARGPTGQPIFGYPTTMLVGVVPSQITVVGTIVVTLSVAINPRSLESGRIEWYTMATQIRPLNLAAAVAINQAGGGRFMSKLPVGLPMTYPTGY
jgi:prepilin-type N-terminal cleavage/methylation domain-containing protein